MKRRNSSTPERSTLVRPQPGAVLLLLILLLSWIELQTLSGGLPDAIRSTPPGEQDGLTFEKPIRQWDEAIPLGNGMIGALVWGDGSPLKISLDRADLWDLSPVPEFHSADYNLRTVVDWHKSGKHAELVRLIEDPYNRPAPTKIPAGRIELTLPGGGHVRGSNLRIRKAVGQVQWDGGGALDVFIHAVDPVGMMRIRSGEPPGVRLVVPPFAGKVMNRAAGGIGAGDLAQLGYPPARQYSNEVSQGFVQRGAEGFEFAIWIEWRRSVEGWTAAWSIASSFEAGKQPLELAKSRVARALTRGFERSLQDHAGWWDRFWAQSTVSLPNPVLHRQWQLETYKFGSASRRGAPPITLQAIWTADNGQLPPWKGDYHHDLNTQLSYWPCYSGNRLEEGLAYLDWLWNTRSNCVAWTRRFYGVEGMNVPMTTDLNNNQIGGWRQYTHSLTTGAWLAHHFDLHWRYTGDRKFLKERALPYLRECSVFIEAVSRNRDARGKRKLPLSSSPEIHDNRPQAWFEENTNYDLALVHWLLKATAEMEREVKNPAGSDRWLRVASEFPELAIGANGGLLVAPGQPLKESHRHFSHLMAIHPLGLLDVRDAGTAERTVHAALEELEHLGPDWWCGYSYSWLGNLAARARDGNRAARALEIFSTAFTLPNSFHCNGDQSGRGYSKMTYRPFTLEGNFAAAAGIQEMLLQSHRGRIEIFPAIPQSWKTASFTTLRAEGGVLVSARMVDGRVEQIELSSADTTRCRLLSPWSGRVVEVALKKGRIKTLTSDP